MVETEKIAKKMKMAFILVPVMTMLMETIMTMVEGISQLRGPQLSK